MRWSVVVFVSLVIVVTGAARFDSSYASYPRVPNGNKRGSLSHELSEPTTLSSLSLKNIGAALKPFQNYFGAGIVFMALLKLVQDNGFLGRNLALSGIGRNIKPNREESSIKELKKDQEEIWNAILNIHNTQKIHKEEIDSNTASLLDLRSEQEAFAQQHRVKMDAVTKRLDEIDQSLLEISQSVADLTLSVDVRELREALNAVEDKVERESRATTASVKQIREELPEMMQRHDSMVAEKLGKFKEDLKRILVGNKPGSGAGANSASEKGNTNKSATKSVNKKK